MPFTVPATWKFHSASGDGQTVTYTRPGHTVKEPRLAIVSRTIPTYDSGRSTWSVPSYRVRVFDGVLNADGQPDPTKTLLDLTARSSLNSNGASRGGAVTADLLMLIQQDGFAGAAFGTQEFPSQS